MTPNDYECCECGAHGVKLWREYNSFHISLKCRACSEVEQAPALERIKKRESSGIGVKIRMADQIGWRVPAVPDGEGNFWGYTSIPQELCDWWDALPEKNLWRKKGE